MIDLLWKFRYPAPSSWSVSVSVGSITVRVRVEGATGRKVDFLGPKNTEVQNIYVLFYSVHVTWNVWKFCTAFDSASWIFVCSPKRLSSVATPSWDSLWLCYFRSRQWQQLTVIFWWRSCKTLFAAFALSSPRCRTISNSHVLAIKNCSR